MAETAIEWTERSWNPIVGCSLASPGCTNCYAMAIADRFKHVYEGRPFAGAPSEAMTRKASGKAVWTGQLTLAPERTLLEPLRRRKPTTWFVNSMGDLFHEDVPDEWIDRVFAVMALAPHHTFQVLTKRAARMQAYVEGARSRVIVDGHVAVSGDGQYFSRKKLGGDWQWPLPNVWLGVSAEDQRRADERIPELLATPAAVRFVSAEPLLGPIDFTYLRADSILTLDALTGLHADCEGAVEGVIDTPDPKLDWVIVGGESGPDARPMHPDWARQIRDQCAAEGTAFFFKQWCEHRPLTNAERGTACGATLVGNNRFESDAYVLRVGKKRAGRLLDGVQHNGMPEASR